MRRQGVGFRRQPAPAATRPAARTANFPAPTRGWISNTNLAKGLAEAALVLDNGFPTKAGVRIRAGTVEWADTGSGDAIESMWTHTASGVTQMFASTVDTIWDVTTTTPAADVTGQTSGDYSTQQFETAGGQFTYAANGTDSPRLYDGTTWTAITGASTPAITGLSGGVTTADLSFVWAYKKRLYFIQAASNTVWYLPIDSIGGAASEMSLRGIFSRGGALVFGATWSLDAGDGMDDKWIAVSDQGEVVVYEGDDPGAANWAIVGRYDLGGVPLGRSAFMRVAGDVLIATDDGLIPLSAVMQKDPETLSLSAISYAIEPDWRREVAARRTLPWMLQKWPEKGMAIVSTPKTDTTTAQCFVLNLQTSGWARYTGWDVRSAAVLNNLLYFGTSDGRIIAAENSGADEGATYSMELALHFSNLGRPSDYKTLTQGRAVFRTGRALAPKLSASVDYATDFPAPPASPADFTLDVWDSALWDVARWDATYGSSVVTTRWVPVTGAGFVHSMQVQVSSGTTPAPDAELMMIDVQYVAGGVVA